MSFFNASLKTHKKSSLAFLFCAIWIFINLTKKLVGGILKKMEMPDSVGRLHISAIKPPLFRERAALLFNSFYLLSKKGLLE